MVTPSSALVVVQTPAAGSLVALGSHPVIVAVADTAGNSTQCSTSFTIVDTTPPRLYLPADLSAEATGPGAVVGYAVSAVDNIDGAVAATCSPVAGSTFPLGPTPVACPAKDAAVKSAAARSPSRSSIRPHRTTISWTPTVTVRRIYPQNTPRS